MIYTPGFGGGAHKRETAKPVQDHISTIAVQTVFIGAPRRASAGQMQRARLP